MSVQQLHPVEDQSVLPAVDAARASLRRVLDVPVASVGTDELTDALASVGVLESQAAALRMRLLAEADRREVATRLGATGTDAWAASLTGSTRAVVAGGLWLGRLLAERYAATRDALAEGAINEAQARVIVTAAEQLPEQVTREHRRAAEAGLVVKAVRGTDARRLRQAARRMLDTATAETARAEAARLRRLADEHEATMLEAEERRAETETWLTLGDRGDGTFVGRFVIPELHGHLLRAWLEQMTSPRRLAGGRDGEPVTDDTLDVSTGAQNLSWSERMGLGFTELLEHLPTSPDGKAGGFSRVGVGVLVHLDHQHLLDGLASAGLDTGVRLSAGAARRLACNAGIIPAVLGTRSEPLDLGRESRLHTVAQRRALAVRHDTCATEGCERPFAWCDVHHPHPWAAGGPTDLANGVPLCGWHHRRAHDGRYTLARLPNGDVRFTRRR